MTMIQTMTPFCLDYCAVNVGMMTSTMLVKESVFSTLSIYHADSRTHSLTHTGTYIIDND
jgi:hypothetical protein